MKKTNIILLVVLILLGGIYFLRLAHKQQIKTEYNECQEWLENSKTKVGWFWTDWQKEQCEYVAGFVFNK